MRPAGTHPLLEGVNKVSALSEYLTAKWDGWAKGTGVLELAHDPESGVPVLWLLSEGKGQIIVSAYGSILGNRLLGEGDNAHLMANIVRWSLRGGGKVIIDDAHQGLVPSTIPMPSSATRACTRRCGGCWACGCCSCSARSGCVRRSPSWNPVDITGFVRATGGFMARVMRPATVGQQMIANFFNDARKRHGLPAGRHADVGLAGRADGRVAEQDVERLQALHAKVQQGQPRQLVSAAQPADTIARRFELIAHARGNSDERPRRFRTTFATGVGRGGARLAAGGPRAGDCRRRSRPRVAARCARPGQNLAQQVAGGSLRGVFKRVQGTSDLMPADITGVHAFDAEQRQFVFRPGPVFADVLLVDEINRAGPKTQSALLEAMEERQVTVDRQNYPAAGQLSGGRDAESSRVRRHVPAARVAARSFHAACRSHLSGARGRAGHRRPLRQHGRACSCRYENNCRRSI